MQRELTSAIESLNKPERAPELSGIFSAERFRDTELIEAQGTARKPQEQNIMANLTYRGVSYQASTAQTVETEQQTTFRGRKSNIISPVKTPVAVPADIQFFGRHATPATLDRNIVLDVAGWATV